jgi:ribosomal protein S18 acetylase RimI-like enzyme
VYRHAAYLIALPLLIRPCNMIEGLESVSALDATCVYGYVGPVSSHRDLPAEVIADFQSSLWDALGSLGVVALFSRLHPLIEQSALVAGLGESSPSGTTVSVDLTLPEEAQIAKVRLNHLRDIKKLRALGASCVSDTSTGLDDFVRMYHETMLRLGAAPHYFFDRAYFAQLAVLRGSYVHLFTCSLNAEVIAAGLFFACEGIIQYHLGASRTEFVELAPMKLILDTVRKWGIESGMHVFHLGGGVGAQEDSLFRFKAGFSDRRHPYVTWRWILDQTQYDAITATKAKWNAEHRVGFASSDHFPQYRCPTSSVMSHEVSMLTSIVGPTNAGVLGQLLPRIDARYFQPHPMTPGEAARIAGLNGRDLYLLGFVDGEAVAYGMLRGWDEGYTVPSLGIGVRRDRIRRGYGRAMMLALHDAARERGARSVRLRVDPDNLAAASLYRSLGYREGGMERGEILMLLDL